MDMSTVPLSQKICIKQEIKQEESNDYGPNLEHTTYIKNESDIEEHKIFIKTEATAFESSFCCVKSEKDQDFLHIKEEIDPLATDPSSDAGSCSDSRDSKEQIKSGDEPAEESASNDKTPYECHICKGKFHRSTQLKKHLHIHTREKRYECNICHKKFAYQSGFNAHIRIHTGEKPFECNVCKKKFAQSSYLVNHSYIHTGEKPHECDICKKKFSQSSNLRVHLRSKHVIVNIEKKSYECNICKKPFSHGSSLSRHLRVHTVEKTFECKICKKPFSHSSSLYRHLRLHTG